MIHTFLGMGFGILLLFAVIWWTPIILIARSQKTTGWEKLAWLLAMFLFSWFSWILYLLIAPVHPPENAR
jgi:hypothetical protein